jgi:hypothetical protein
MLGLARCGHNGLVTKVPKNQYLRGLPSPLVGPSKRHRPATRKPPLGGGSVAQVALWWPLASQPVPAGNEVPNYWCAWRRSSKKIRIGG